MGAGKTREEHIEDITTRNQHSLRGEKGKVTLLPRKRIRDGDYPERGTGRKRMKGKKKIPKRRSSCNRREVLRGVNPEEGKSQAQKRKSARGASGVELPEGMTPG